MTDIVERLRQRHKLSPLDQSVFSDAIAEIERLRAERQDGEIVRVDPEFKNGCHPHRRGLCHGCAYTGRALAVAK